MQKHSSKTFLGFFVFLPSFRSIRLILQTNCESVVLHCFHFFKASKQEKMGKKTNVIFVREQIFTLILFLYGNHYIYDFANFLTNCNFGDPFSIQPIFCRLEKNINFQKYWSPNVQTREIKMPCPAKYNFLN